MRVAPAPVGDDPRVGRGRGLRAGDGPRRPPSDLPPGAADADRRRRAVSASVLTWTEARPIELAVSERLRRVAASHHGMWNYVTYRDAIGLLGLDPAEIYPAGTTRLD